MNRACTHCGEHTGSHSNDCQTAAQIKHVVVGIFENRSITFAAGFYRAPADPPSSFIPAGRRALSDDPSKLLFECLIMEQHSRFYFPVARQKCPFAFAEFLYFFVGACLKDLASMIGDTEHLSRKELDRLF
jgi:hypothetical protein